MWNKCVKRQKLIRVMALVFSPFQFFFFLSGASEGFENIIGEKWRRRATEGVEKWEKARDN